MRRCSSARIWVFGGKVGRECSGAVPCTGNAGNAGVQNTPWGGNAKVLLSLPQGVLYLANSGYLILQRMCELSDQGDFWLTHIRANLIITNQQGIRRDLSSFMASRLKKMIDEWVWVMADRQLFCRC